MPFVRPDVAAFLDLANKAPGPKINEMAPVQARKMMRDMGMYGELPRGEIRRVEDISIPAPEGHAIPARLYAHHAAATLPAPVLLYFHGGGWVIGDLETHDSLCAEIARESGLTVIAVDYRLAPEYPFPAGINDCFTATRWAASAPDIVGHGVTGLVVTGDSAGGNFAAITAQELNGQLPVPILVQWLIYPGVDMLAEGGSLDEFAEGYLLTRKGAEWFHAHYLGDTPPDPTHPHLSPMHGRFHGVASALVFTCGLDPIRDQGRAYAGRLIAHGVRTIFREAAGQIHNCFLLRRALPSAQGDLAGCIADLKILVHEAEAEATMAQAAGGRA